MSTVCTAAKCYSQPPEIVTCPHIAATKSRSRAYHTERPPYLFAARSPWCSASRGFVSDSWSRSIFVTHSEVTIVKKSQKNTKVKSDDKLQIMRKQRDTLLI